VFNQSSHEPVTSYILDLGGYNQLAVGASGGIGDSNHISSDRVDPESYLPYSRAQLNPRIVHFGISNFFAAHLGTIIEDLNCAQARWLQEPSWGIVAVSMRSPEKVQQLRKQNHLYTVGAVENDSREVSLVGSVVASVHGPTDPQILANYLESADMATFTVTQGAYFVDGDPREGRLRTCDEIREDVATLVERVGRVGFERIGNGAGYRTALAPVVEELAQRFVQNRPPLVVMSLDNTPPWLNGDILRVALSNMAAQLEEQITEGQLKGFADFIWKKLPVLSTVVDRITPQQDTVDKSWMYHPSGISDGIAVVTERHRCLKYEVEDPAGYLNEGQVVIPDFSLVSGVSQVPSVAAHVHMKSRLINSLDVIAGQLGTRAGFSTLGEFLSFPSFQALEEAVLTTELGRGVGGLKRPEIHCFIEEVQARRRNAFISGVNTLNRLNNKGTSKMPNRIGAAIAALSDDTESAKALTLTNACYLRTLLDQMDETGAAVQLQDDSPEKVAQIAATYARASSLAAVEVFQSGNAGLADSRTMLLDAQETAGIEALLDQESWLFGTGFASSDGREILVSELPSFRQRLTEYFIALRAQPNGQASQRVLEVSRSIVNPLKCPTDYFAN
jgi:mannitol-1-phosphate/altronate dehydrogenase